MKSRELLSGDALSLEEALNDYINRCIDCNHAFEQIVAFRFSNSAGGFEFIAAADEVTELPDGVSNNPSSIILGSFQRKNETGETIFGYATKEGYGCKEKTVFAAVCRDDIFERPCAENERNIGQLHVIS